MSLYPGSTLFRMVLAANKICFPAKLLVFPCNVLPASQYTVYIKLSLLGAVSNLSDCIYVICHRQNGTWREISQSAPAISFQHHHTNAPYVIDKMELGGKYLRALLLSPVSTTAPMLHSNVSSILLLIKSKRGPSQGTFQQPIFF